MEYLKGQPQNRDPYRWWKETPAGQDPQRCNQVLEHRQSQFWKKGEHSQPKKDEKPVMLEFHKPESTFTSYHLYQGKSQTSIKLPWYLLLINTQRPLHLQGLPQVQMWNSFFPNHGRSSAAEVPEMKRDLQPRVSGRFSFTEPPLSLVKPNPCPLRGKLAQAPGV